MRRLLVSAGLVLALTLFIGAFYKASGLHVNPFRAESGVYLASAHGPDKSAFLRKYVISPYNGHFTPVVFGAEFAQARILGASERGWFWRQMLVLGLLGAALVRFANLVFSKAGLSPGPAAACAVLSACIFIFQPTIVELAAWPFMSFQLLCLTCAGMAAYYVTRLCESAARRDLVLFLFWGYAAMHCFGVGAAISAAAVGVGGLIVWALRMLRSSWGIVAGFATLTVLHAYVMSRSAGQDFGQPLPLSVNVERFGAFFVGSVYAGVRSLWANGRFPWPNVEAFTVDSVYGVGLFLIAMSTALLLAYRAREDRAALTTGAIVAFPIGALALYCFLTVFRNRAIPDPHIMDTYFFGTRYIVFPAFFVFLAGTAAVVPLARSLRGLVVLPVGIAAASCMLATSMFLDGAVPKLWPHISQSSQSLWNREVDEARHQLASSGAVRDKRLVALDPEFQNPMSIYTGVLERELDCNGCVRFQGE